MNTDKEDKVTQQNRCSTIRDFVKLNLERGLWPSKLTSVQHLWRNSKDNGFQKAFHKVSGFLLVDEKEFWIALRAATATPSCPPRRDPPSPEYLQSPERIKAMRGADVRTANIAKMADGLPSGHFTDAEFVRRNKEKGWWPKHTKILQLLRKSKKDRGFSRALYKKGRHHIVDEDKFWEIAEAHAERRTKELQTQIDKIRAKYTHPPTEVL